MELIPYFYNIMYEHDTRTIQFSIFESKLQKYYDKQECDIEFELIDGDCVSKFWVKPRGKCYFYDLVYIDGEHYSETEVFQIIKEILFPNEKNFISNIEQWYGKNSPIRISIKKIK